MNKQILLNSRLTKQGYIVNKSDLSEQQIEDIESELTVEPEVDQRFKKKSAGNIEDTAFNVYLETISGEKFVLPRYYGIVKFGIPNNVKFDVLDIDKINVSFKGKLRDYQIDVMNTILPEYCNDINNPSTTLKQFGGSIISIPPGKGKTVLAINLITQLKVRALIVVHKTFLLNQWFDRINQYTDAKIGIIQQDKIDITNKSIVVAMLQSISLKDYDKELFQAFPLVIYDECHHLGAKMFSKSLIKVQAPYYLGLSATPERKDSLDKVFKYFLGDIKYRGKFEPNNQVKVKLYSYFANDIKFKTIYNHFTKTFMMPKMITNICKIDKRNDFIVHLIKEIIHNEPTRKILVLTGRCNTTKSDKSVDHIKEISDRLDKMEDFKDNWGYYKGGMKKVQLELSSEKQIIIGTYDMAQEGLDIATLDTLILATPLKGDITQTCGRILRGGSSSLQPLIIDIVDMIKPFSEQAKYRYGYYLSNNYNCEYYNVQNDHNNIKKLDIPFLLPSVKKTVIRDKTVVKQDETKEDIFNDD